MIIEDIKEPCNDCVHKTRCSIINPWLDDNLGEHDMITRCDKLDKFSSYVDVTRPSY